MSGAALRLAAALLIALLAELRLPLPPNDSLRGTLIILPLVMAALAALGSWARERGGRAVPQRLAAGELALLSLLVLLAVGRHGLGLSPISVSDRLLAAGFAVLLAHRVGWLLPALRPALGTRLERSPPWPFFALPLVVYLAILPWTMLHHLPDGDEPHYLLLTHSLAHDLDTDLANNYEQGDALRFLDRRLEPQLGDPVGHQGQLYSRHNMLLPLVLAPLYRLSGLSGALLMMAVFAAATCWLTLGVARHYLPERPGEALAAWAILAFTAPWLLFSYQVWVEVPAALLVLLALRRIADLSQPVASPWRTWIALALPLLLLPMLKIRFLLIAVPLAVLALWRADRRTRKFAGLVIGALLGLGIGILLFNQLVFDNPLKYHDIDGLRPYLFPPLRYLRGLTGLFFDCAFGLFSQAPLWMLLLPAAMIVASRQPRMGSDFLVIFVPYLFLLSPRGEWFGGWSPPFRYGIVMLPLLALWLVPLLAGRRRPVRRALIASLLVLSLALTLLWLVEPGWTYNLAHGRSHLVDQLTSRFKADVARFFPSSARLRAATAIWPPAALLAIAVLWWWPGRRHDRHSALWGTAAALLLLPPICWAAQHRPTRIVEFEDPWIGREAGQLHPALWVVYRPQYRGSWILPAGARIRVPVVPGGQRLSLRVDLRALPRRTDDALLEVIDGSGRAVGHQQLRLFGQWTSVSFPDLHWSGSGELTLLMTPSAASPQDLRMVLDRAFLTWSRR